MTTSHRYITSLLMTTIYLLIVFTPLAPLAMQSKAIAHAVTGECSGDCRIDDCSRERSAAHTCCCWQKKKHGPGDAHLHSDAEACSIIPKKRAGCCDAPAQNSHEKSEVTKSASTSAPQKTKPLSIGSAPCGSGTLLALLPTETTRHLPYIFSADIPSPEQSPLTVILPDILKSRYVEPPDPPPIISSAS